MRRGDSEASGGGGEGGRAVEYEGEFLLVGMIKTNMEATPHVHLSDGPSCPMMSPALMIRSIYRYTKT